jgi:regulator of RNase E activity RraA
MNIVREISKYPVALISDGVDAVQLKGGVLPPIIRNLAGARRGRTAAGRARTLLLEAVAPRTIPSDEQIIANCKRHEQWLAKGDAVVIAFRDQPSHAAAFGLLRACVYRKSGAKLVVADGLVRDVDEIRKLQLPLFARGATPLNGLGRLRMLAFDEPVQIGGIDVCKNDLVAADNDGIVIVSADDSALRELLRWLAIATKGERLTLRRVKKDGRLSEAYPRYRTL